MRDRSLPGGLRPNGGHGWIEDDAESKNLLLFPETCRVLGEAGLEVLE